jgi:hypothetical protein
MFRFACLCAFALVSTNAFACQGAFNKAMAMLSIQTGHGTAKDRQIQKEPNCGERNLVQGMTQSLLLNVKKKEQFPRDMDAKLQAMREYDQRDRLSADEDRRQSLIQGQLNQLNMNTIPRY